ncbi:MAG: YbaN family protein [Fibromonadaceae bacterium]|jgi:uncharacterized membrane protein YbaN (DUF454 family)|nr:YbaN family protein [Fibromonadaceae bacterium]
MKKKIFAAFGILCVICGSIGIVMPLVPTTPFLLLAAYLFARSSPKMHKFLLENKVFGKYLSNYLNNKPIPVRQKLISIFFVWLSIGSTIYLVTLPLWVVCFLLFLILALSIHIATLGFFRKKRN